MPTLPAAVVVAVHDVVPHRMELPARPTSPAEARRFVGEALVSLDVHAPFVTETALLLTSELVTNAVRHATGPLEVAVGAFGECVRISVGDRSPHLPRLPPRAADATSGRGLGLVERLAEDWGVDGNGGGKTVWFLLRKDLAIP